jgi:uncharacterized protein YdeI (YjbR/CyaY-like superfamily)
MKPLSKSFQATLERIDSPLKWVMVRVPFDAGKVWGKRGQLKVRGEINGFAFRTSLFPDGKGRHRLLVNKEMQRGAKAAPGMSAQFQLEPDNAERVVTVPVELNRFLSEEKSLRRWFNELNHSTRTEICKWIVQAGSRTVRLRRAEQMAERLLATMEAEQELPPTIQMALEKNPQALEGWKMMSPARRRSHLLGIFYYRTPEARARRTAKALEDAVQLMQKKKMHKSVSRRA